MESCRKYKCEKCQTEFTVNADLLNQKEIEPPKMCENREKNCKGNKFVAMPDSTEAIDFQECYLQEQITKLQIGSIPRNIRVVFLFDLADCCQVILYCVICKIIFKKKK